MSDEPDTTSDTSDEQPAKKSKKKLIIIAAAVLLLGGGAGGAYMSGMMDSMLGTQSDEDGEHADGTPADGAPIIHADDAPILYHKMPSIIANLHSETQRPEFIKADITFEYRGDETLAKITELQPKIEDSISSYFSELSKDSIRGRDNLNHLRDEIQDEVNELIAPYYIDGVLFSQLLAQ